MFSTRFTELVGCDVPIQLAPMGAATTPDLAAAVTSAGAHAMLPLTGVPLRGAAALLEVLEQRHIHPYGVNFLVPFLDPEVLEFIATRVALVDLYLGPPERDLVEIVHAGGALAGWQITSLAEAVAAEEAGCDLIIAHGVEAGGRNPGGIGLISLLAQVLDTVHVPVLAAGGIATGRGVAAALAMGADGVRLGTRFIASVESGAHRDYVAAVVGATAEDAIHSHAFHLMFPPDLAGSRVLRTAVDAVEAARDEAVGEMELPDGQRVPLPRFAPVPPSTGTTGNIAAMALYAGQSAGSVHRVQPAAEIVAELVREAERCMARFSQGAPHGSALG